MKIFKMGPPAQVPPHELMDGLLHIPNRLDQGPINPPIENGKSQDKKNGEIDLQGIEGFRKNEKSDDPEANENRNEKAGNEFQRDFPSLFHALIEGS